jgi:hypothetical protein
MKKILIQLMIILSLTLAGTALYSQPGPPPPPDEHGLDGDQSAGGMAPIGSGVAILLSLGAAYGGRKLYQNWRKIQE